MNKKNVIKFISFSFLTALMITGLDLFVFVPFKETNIYNEFYNQEENSLDVVCIGNSTVRHGFNTCVAWNEYNITSYNVCASPTHPEVICIAIDEVARTQTPDLIYIDLNGLTWQTIESKNSFVKAYIENMPECERKQELLQQYPDIVLTEEKGIFKDHNNYRNSAFWEYLFYGKRFYMGFNAVVTKQKQLPFTLENTVMDLPEDGQYYLTQILDICDKYPSIKFIFGKTPRFLNDNIAVETYKLRSAIPEIEARGYEYIEYESILDTIGLDREEDCFDQHHLNIKGSEKFTRYFLDDVINRYGVTSKTKSSQVQESYNDMYQNYINRYGKYL